MTTPQERDAAAEALKVEALNALNVACALWNGTPATQQFNEQAGAAEKRCRDAIEKLAALSSTPPVGALTNAEKAAYWKRWCDELEAPPLPEPTRCHWSSAGMMPDPNGSWIPFRAATEAPARTEADVVQREDGEGFTVPLGEVYRLACCDCGLVHDVVWEYEGGELGMAARRNEEATKERREAGAQPSEARFFQGELPLKPIGYIRLQDGLEYAPVMMLYATRGEPENGHQMHAMFSEDQVRNMLASQPAAPTARQMNRLIGMAARAALDAGDTQNIAEMTGANMARALAGDDVEFGDERTDSRGVTWSRFAPPRVVPPSGEEKP